MEAGPGCRRGASTRPASRGGNLARGHRKQVLPTVKVQCQVGGLSRVVSLGTEPHEDGRGNSPLLTVNGIKEVRLKVLPSVLLSGGATELFEL